MTCRPKNNTNKEIKLSIITAIAAALIFLFSGVVSKFVIVYQISALLLAVFALEVYVKYVANDYVYESTEKELKIYRITGKKSICIASLDYEMSISNIVCIDDYNKNKDGYPKANFNVNYAKNLAQKNYYVYFFEFNGRRSMMKFEPDSAFVEYANEKINNVLKSTKEAI